MREDWRYICHARRRRTLKPTDKASKSGNQSWMITRPAISSRPKPDKTSFLIPLLDQAPVCTENLILVDYVTESPNVNGDDRAALFLLGPVRLLALQIEEPTGGRERCAPSSTDCAAAQDAGSRPAHKWGSLVLPASPGRVAT